MGALYRRGTELLLAHCAAVFAWPAGAEPADAEPTVDERLEAALGSDLSRLLPTALVPAQRGVRRGGSSSP